MNRRTLLDTEYCNMGQIYHQPPKFSKLIMNLPISHAEQRQSPDCTALPGPSFQRPGSNFENSTTNLISLWSPQIAHRHCKPALEQDGGQPWWHFVHGVYWFFMGSHTCGRLCCIDVMFEPAIHIYHDILEETLGLEAWLLTDLGYGDGYRLRSMQGWKYWGLLCCT